MTRFLDGEFPPGLLNPGPLSRLAEDDESWCARLLGMHCPTLRELIFNVFFTGHGIWLLLPLSLAMLIMYRLVGPPEVDEREEQLRRQWEEHRQRFRSGAKRSSLRGVIKSSYLPELGYDGQGRRLDPTDERERRERHLRSGAQRQPTLPGDRSVRLSDEESWEDVTSGDEALAIANKAVAESGTVVNDTPMPWPRETVHVLTTPGPTRVTIVGDRGAGAAADGSVSGGTAPGQRRVSIVTLHAAGHNHRTCFGALERSVEKDLELLGERVVFYHVDIPGHEEEQRDGLEGKELSLEALAVQLLQVTIKLGLEWFIGLGVGAGANVLLRFACDHPEKMAGLILANGSADRAGRRERNTRLPARFRLSREKDMKAARESLVPLSYPPHSSLASRYRAALGAMHPGNVLKYLDAELMRDDIPASRLQAINDVWTLVLCGTEPADAASAGIVDFLTSFVAGVSGESAARSIMEKLDAASRGTPAKASLVTLPGGGDGGGILEAKPFEALAAMKLFLNKCL